jgi:RimJ/RimL family protein N-acetyltransferase
MSLAVREMAPDEVALIIDYFHDATPEHLEMLGVDPTRLPARERWRERYADDYARPVKDRSTFLIAWELEGALFGFSIADKIAYGEQAHMHLHIADPDLRRAGLGAQCVAASVELYFSQLELKRLICEPHAFNVAPNRTLQKAGFRYVKTYMTVPGPLNYHQPVTRWTFESSGPSRPGSGPHATQAQTGDSS